MFFYKKPSFNGKQKLRLIRVTTLLSYLAGLQGYSQDPKISGLVDINLSEGKISCNLTITNIPPLEDPAFALNRGLNVHDLSVNGKSVSYNIDWGFPGRSAFFSNGIGYVPNVDSITAETKITFSYVGAFPTYAPNESVANGDHMGSIAFKNKIIRASHQALWYPILTDRATNVIFSKYSSEITITCKDCETIYLGGTDPVRSQKVKLKSETPNDLMLYSGKFSFSKAGQTFFLNSALSKNVQYAVNSALDSIKMFYSGFIHSGPVIPLVLAQIFSTGSKVQYENWAFSVYPFISTNLYELTEKIHAEKNCFSDIGVFRIYSHELAHQYFGLQVKSNNAYWGFYSESFAEYLSLKAIEKTYGKQAYQMFIRERYITEKTLAGKYIQLDSIKTDPDNMHKYNYYPMILLGLEQCIGHHKMFVLLDYLVTHNKSSALNFDTLRQSALESGILPEEWEEFEGRYIKTNNCLPHVAAKL